MDINGTPQADTLLDTVGDDNINAGDGDDRIDVTNGQDLVDGGAGNDFLRILWSAETGAISVGAAPAGFDFRLVAGAGRSVSFRGIERTLVEAGSGNDSFTMGATNDEIVDGPRSVDPNLATGDDTLGGGGGDDVINVQTGNDSADGGDGFDAILIGWSGSTTPIVNAAAPVGFQGRYESGPGRSINLAGFERILITGGTANDVITTFGGNDSLVDGPGTTFDNDVLNGGAGNDGLRTTTGHDSLDGGEDFDVASVFWTSSTAPIITVAAPAGFAIRFESGPDRSVNLVNMESVTIFSGTGNDNVTGGAGNETFSDRSGGNSGNDVFAGGGGSDTHIIRSGHDRGDGGIGPGDVAVIEWFGVTSPITNAAPSAGYEIRFQAGSSHSAELKDFEAIEFDAGSGADVLSFGNSRDTVYAGGGNDIVNGGDGNDTLYGGSGADGLSGGDGNDTLYGESGADSLFGDAGDDSGFLDDDSDSFTGGAGVDTALIVGQYASFTARVSPDTEVLLLVSGTDTRFTNGNLLYDYSIVMPNGPTGANSILTVQATGLVVGEDLRFDGSAQQNGAFRIFAGRGVDELIGGAANDGFFFDADANASLTGADRVNGGGGTDTIALRGDYVGARAVTFAENSMTGVEVITFLTGLAKPFGGPIVPAGFDYAVTMANGNVAAGARMDVVGGTLGADESVAFDGRAETDGSYRIFLGAGSDSAFGSQGADLIYGAGGADQLDGSGGADTYVYRLVSESTAAAADTIQLGDGDKIDFGTIDADSVAAGNQSFAFIGGQAFGNVAGQLRAAQSGNIWIVEGDVNGDGVADLVINVTSADAIVAGDFIL